MSLSSRIAGQQRNGHPGIGPGGTEFEEQPLGRDAVRREHRDDAHCGPEFPSENIGRHDAEIELVPGHGGAAQFAWWNVQVGDEHVHES